VTAWLRLSSMIDALNRRVGRAVSWLILAMTVVSAANAVSRKAFNASSNAFLEVQWYLFAAVFLLAAGYTLQRNGHVRIDVLSSRLAPRTRLWIELVATLLFLFPFAFIVLRHGVPFFMDAVTQREVSINAGGLVVWPVKLLVPAGFALLLLQGLSQVVKTIAALRGVLPVDAPFTAPPDAASART
jgi:TRAP-type mannitol/chloroaromatic compound transport system permease small subunit